MTKPKDIIRSAKKKGWWAKTGIPKVPEVPSLASQVGSAVKKKKRKVKI